MEEARSTPAEMPPSAVMMQLLFGKHITYSLSALARLGVADHMNGEPKPVEDIAAAVGAHADALYRVLRMLSSVGVFRQDGRAFALTPVGHLLQTKAPGTLRHLAWMFCDEWSTRAFEQLPNTLKTGVDGVTAAYGKGAFDLLGELPEQCDTFQKAMSDLSQMEAEAILVAGDFSGITRLADVGGGHGTLLARILLANPSLKGVLCDLPEIAGQALSGGHFAGCEERVEIVPGSFFDAVPAGCDAYLLKHIIHDWSDELCQRILILIRDRLAAHAPQGRVIICEMLVPDGPEPAPAKMLDIEMLALTGGGRERTVGEFTALLGAAGLKLERIVPTHSPMCLIEARLG